MLLFPFLKCRNTNSNAHRESESSTWGMLHKPGFCFIPWKLYCIYYVIAWEHSGEDSSLFWVTLLCWIAWRNTIKDLHQESSGTLCIPYKAFFCRCIPYLTKLFVRLLFLLSNASMFCFVFKYVLNKRISTMTPYFILYISLFPENISLSTEDAKLCFEKHCLATLHAFNASKALHLSAHCFKDTHGHSWAWWFFQWQHLCCSWWKSHCRTQHTCCGRDSWRAGLLWSSTATCTTNILKVQCSRIITTTSTLRPLDMR